MKAKHSRILTLSAIGVGVLALCGGVTIAAEAQSKNLDLLLGRGDLVIDDDGSGLKGEYYDWEFDSQDKALKNAQEKTQQTAEEGITLLKNENGALPLASAAKVTILGYYAWHNNMSGGEDPATTNGAVSLAVGMKAAFDTNAEVNALYEASNGEIALSALQGVESTFTQYDTAVIVIKRNSGEGSDQVRDSGAAEGNRTGLTLNNAEIELIDYANQKFNKVVLVVNSANAMELGFLKAEHVSNGVWQDPYSSKTMNVSKMTAALWAGCCGSQGGTALANILKGTVNPSGHLVDTYVSDLKKDPTWNNFGSYLYTNSADLGSYQGQTFFVDYEEGIYMGYRYYETAAAEAAKNNYQGFNYNDQVVYPFGHGLSYTTFTQEFDGDPVYDAATGEYTLKVKVTNTGSVAGKGVAQVYVSAPWENGQAEKSHVVLAGFGKTKVLAAGASETLTIKVQEDFFATFDYKTNKAYVLDAGDYKFYVANDNDGAHSWATIDAENATEQAKHLKKVSLSKKVFNESGVGKRKTDLTVAKNVEDDELNYKFKEYNEGSAGDGFIHNFTRANFKDSFPTAPAGQDFVVSDARAKQQIAKYDVWDESQDFIKEEVTIDTDETSYTLADMRGVKWDDEKWDDYMNQFTLQSMYEMFSNGGWNELADEENGVPLSYDCDSPYGYYGHALSIKNINKWYCGDPMVAATFNVELAKAVGDAFGEEAHANYLAGGTLITGLYGYGANTHRSAFGGRNYEYYSEDPLLAGKMAAHEASGASEKGLITFMKHFALNDQETNRQKNGYCAYVNEQAFREIYVKPWEIYSKEAKMQVKHYTTNDEGKYELTTTEMNAATGIMTAYNRIGATYAGASVSLNAILRDECGYTGTTITDAGGEPTTYMNTDQMLRRGGHLTLANNGSNGLWDTESNTAKYFIKDSAKHILFNKANSNIIEGLTPGQAFHYTTSPWRLGVMGGWIGVGALALIDAAVITLIATDKIKVSEKAKKASEETGEEF